MRKGKLPLYEKKYRINKLGNVDPNKNLDYWDGMGFSCGVENYHRGLSKTRDGRYFVVETNDRYPSRDNAYLISNLQAYQEICRSRNFLLFQEGLFRPLMAIPKEDISRIINIDSLKLFCDNDELDEILIYGERVEMEHCSDDPLRILILPCPGNTHNIGMIYSRLRFYLRQDIKIDLKVVDRIDKGYHGTDYATGEPFTLYWHDLPIYISITKHSVSVKSEYERVKPIDGSVDDFNRR